MIPAGAFIVLGILAACAGVLLATLLLALVRAAAPSTPEERQLEDEEQLAALRRMRPGVCHDCGRDLRLVHYGDVGEERCGSCQLAHVETRARRPA